MAHDTPLHVGVGAIGAAAGLPILVPLVGLFAFKALLPREPPDQWEYIRWGFEYGIGFFAVQAIMNKIL